MRAAIAAAQERHWKIVPACSYALAQFERHPQWALLWEKF
jgi:predicted GNAT family acetyltransferase